MSIKLKLEGFDELLKEIEKAGGKIDNSVKSCMNKSAKIMQIELKDEMQKSNVDSGLINRMPPPEIENDHGMITARVGYRKGEYNQDNLSDGYKVLFANYGTPYRKEHGKIVDIAAGGTIRLGFIVRAKNRAKRKIKAEQEKTLQEILKGLQR